MVANNLVLEQQLLFEICHAQEQALHLLHSHPQLVRILNHS